MSVGTIIILGVCILFLFVLISSYYYHLSIRFVSVINKRTKKEYGKKQKIVFLVLGVILSICTINFFSVIGVFLLYFLGISLIMELVNGIAKCVFKKKENKIWKFLYKSLMLPVLATAVIMIYGYYNINHIVKTEYTITSDKISKDYDIALITDVHYGTILNKQELDAVCNRISKENANLVILGGDIVDESTTKEQMQEVISGLAKIKNEDGIYYINGNHDRQQYSSAQVYTDEEYRELIESNQIEFLRDEWVEINEEFTLIGRKDFSEKNRVSIEELLQNANKEKFIISADHQPVEYAEASNAGVDLLVSGHTHGGQLFPVGYFIQILKTADLYYGKTEVGNMKAIVSSGLCGWGYPVRTQKHCEYVVIHIKSVP